MGRWTGADGTVRHPVLLDGQLLHPGAARPASAYRALGPWPTPGGHDTVHESTVPLAQVLQALVVAVVAGTYLAVDAQLVATLTPPQVRPDDETPPPGPGVAA